MTRRLPPARILFHVATIGAIGLVARALIEGPLRPSVAVTAFVAYLLLLAAGIGILRLGVFVDVVFRGPRGARGVALTFDDGPSREHTPRVLDMLDRAKTKATFFVIGKKAEAHPELVREIAARGHAIGVHGHDHDRLSSLRSPARIAADLSKALAAVEAATGARPSLYRPPVGLTSPRIARALERFEVTVVGWSVRALDGWSGAKPERVAERVAAGLEDGAIVLLHDAAERDDRTPASVAALPRILEAMRRKDLAGVRLDAWFGEGHRRARPAGDEATAGRRRGRGRRARRSDRSAARRRACGR